MKTLVIALFVVVLAIANFAQTKTIILVRHAEKEIVPAELKNDVSLSEAGRKRAERLFQLIKYCKPEQIFSTPLRRTRETAEPLAVSLQKDSRLWIEAYSTSDLESFAEKLKKLPVRCVVVIGHTNTTPELANILLDTKKYKDLLETEFGKIFFITIKGKKITDKVIDY